MRKRSIKRASLGELLDAYAQAASVHGRATETGDYKTGNRAADRVAAIYAELRARGPDAQRSLLGLLKHEVPGVRGWAAAHALDFAPSDGEAVLQALIPMGGFVGHDAEMTLKEWRQGRLKFP